MDDKAKGIISYVFGWIGGLIVLLAFKDNNKKTTIHACQSIIASAAVFVINTIYRYIPIYIPFFSTVMWALQIIVLIVGIIKVVNNEEAELPVLGNLAKSIFAKKIAEAPDVVNTNTTTSNAQAQAETQPQADEQAQAEETKQENNQ